MVFMNSNGFFYAAQPVVNLTNLSLRFLHNASVFLIASMKDINANIKLIHLNDKR